MGRSVCNAQSLLSDLGFYFMKTEHESFGKYADILNTESAMVVVLWDF